MMKRAPWLAISLLLLVLTSCGPASLDTLSTPASPPNTGPWTLKLTQSGGFAGVLLTVQVTSEGVLTATDERSGRSASRVVPAEALAQLNKLIPNTNGGSPSPAPSACADCFIYDLQMTSARGTWNLHLDDTTIGASPFESLIHLMQQLRDDALRA